MTLAKHVQSVTARPPVHWVGDGFPVSSVFSPASSQTDFSPFILMDYAGPATFEPSHRPRGVDTHPHRGFETVTLVFQGELEHRDSAGNSGSIGPRDVQWMTAASGILHEEKHSQAFTRRGGVLEMAQLWVNLPAAKKMQAPRYQELRDAAIPRVSLPNDAGLVRVIAGAYRDRPGAATTATPVILWDVRAHAGNAVELPIPEGFNAAVYVRRGAIAMDGSETAREGQLVHLTREGQGARVRAEDDSELLVLGGTPIDEPVVAHGPFVMNTQNEIRQAIADLQAGRFGSL